MEEIQAGEYARTKRGYIKYLSSKTDYFDVLSKVQGLGNITKHSKNIIDLIEVGDIINLNGNKYEIIYDESYAKLGILIPNRKQLEVRHCSIEYIFSKNGFKDFQNIKIVTKEQFAKIEYKVEE